MTRLSVNLNKVALLRNTRTIGIPSVTRSAQICIDAGAYGITVHPRPDQRHIRPSDVYELNALVSDVEFNIEGNPFEAGYLDIVRSVKPTQCTLVPDTPDAFTSDHGWELSKDGDRLKPIIQELKSLGSRVSLFMDYESDEIPRAALVGADRIELYTEPYADAFREEEDLEAVFEGYARAAAIAQDAGLGVNAGHDLNLENLGRFCSIPGVLEVSIGHALIGEALEMGLANTVKAYLGILAKT
ncbi:MAG: pyridoxine 5'-phosphate synthase [Gemmatimonadota bacterium]|nr:pyridoxine 5'-phosphate synthase [Gemmatimonadota bacterium]